MRTSIAAILILLAGCDGNHPIAVVEDLTPPPFSGGVYIDPGVITSADPTSFARVTYEGTEFREVYDHREDAEVSVESYIYTAAFVDGVSFEVIVNSDLFTDEATLQSLVEHQAQAIGRLPKTLRTGIVGVVMHSGSAGFWSLFGNIYIYADSATQSEASGFLEETLAHEAAHASLDLPHLGSPGWQAAQQADPTFISTYAQNYPNREDLADSIVPWLAVRHRSDRINEAVRTQILSAIPNRLEYLDSIPWDM